ncbi:MAG TPA: SHOCT domain-containing protein [Candidatus Elarobacter sp.]|jgi:hypothetical protein
MRYSTTPAWIYVMLIVMGIGFGAGSVPFALFVPAPAGPLVGFVWLAMASGFVIFSVRALANRKSDERIRQSGTRAVATVVSAKTTGWVINNVPQWALRLRIDGAGAPYETGFKLCTYSPPPNGASFTVRIDPARREHVVMAGDGDADARAGGTVFSPTGAAAGADVGTLIADALRSSGVGSPGTTTTVNADGSRTITSTSVQVGGAPADTAETVRLLGELEKMRASGALGDAEFDSLKRKLLGED